MGNKQSNIQFGNNAIIAPDRFSKGINYNLESTTRCISLSQWRQNTHYRQGNIVHTGRLWASDIEWAMCMQPHKSTKENEPNPDDIFEDILIDIIPQIQTILIEHVQGFNEIISNIVLSYAYKTTQYWWNGCTNNGCGNLQIGYGDSLCKKCRNKKLGTFDNISTYNYNGGAIIKIDKDTNDATRLIVSDNKQDDNENNKMILKTKKNLVFNKNVNSSVKKQKIFNLLKRNFNKAMEPIIFDCCLKKDKVSVIVNKKKIEIGNVNIWALYGDKNENELLCGLIWRSVAATIKEKIKKNGLMFEVLFLSTSEHVRHEAYGIEMVRKIYNYAIANCYDIISVAAVPNHGMSFWEKNGLKK
eukprot:140886_1